MGLLFNGLVKIPMQFLILLTGVLVFVYYQYNTPPVFFNKTETALVKSGAYAEEFEIQERKYGIVCSLKTEALQDLSLAIRKENHDDISNARSQVMQLDEKASAIRKDVISLIGRNNPGADTNDTDYVFLNFVMEQFPHGLIGLLIAVIFLASMGSTASGLNSLASTTVVDVYKRLVNSHAGEKKDLFVSRFTTFLWGVFCVVVAFYAKSIGNLIEAVNILGSFFYGTVLGIFMVAFYMKRISGTAVFYAAIIAQICVILAWYFNIAAFLWLNVIGCLLVMGSAALIQITLKRQILN
jgi:solute:Na+ symporter, SSS family